LRRSEASATTRALRADVRQPGRLTRLPGCPARRRGQDRTQGGYPILSLAGRAPDFLLNESGTGYWPSKKLRIAACCSSTGSMLAAVLIPAGSFTTSIAARYVAAA